MPEVTIEQWAVIRIEGAGHIEVVAHDRENAMLLLAKAKALPPAAATPEIGVAEWAGWVPGGQQMLVAREARGQGRYRKSFEVVRLEGLTTERVTGDVAALPLFQRWQDPAWKRQTLSLR